MSPLLTSIGVTTLAVLATASPFPERNAPKQPRSFLKELGPSTWVLGNDLWNVTQGAQYATKLMYKGKDRVGNAVGHYVSYNGAASDLNWTSAAIVDSGPDWLNIRFTAAEGDFHWVLHDTLPGAYQYFVNRALPTLGEFRTLWRLSNTSFPNAHTNVKDGALPQFSEYLNATNVQDETWQKPDGTFLTKYDWAAFLRDQTAYGVYGPEVGSWYIHAGHEYFNGDHLKQELMLHRESKTGDTVQLNMLHGTHYQAISRDAFATDGSKIWGPWLWYLNDGSVRDAEVRWEKEVKEWPYKWFKDSAYQARGKVEGKLVLGDGRPAAGAAVFLGDDRNETVSTLDQGKGYYYTGYADAEGRFRFDNVRTGTYGLYAWANGGNVMEDVTTNFTHNDVSVAKGETTKLQELNWPVTEASKRIFQIGALDRKTDGFYLADPAHPVEHARLDKCPANLTYTVGTSSPAKDWCFAQSKLGTWSVSFSLPSSISSSSNSTTPAANLILSLAGFSQGSSADVLLNEARIGNISSASLLNSQDTYRGATRAGEWRRLQFEVPQGLLRQGQSNRLDVRVTKSAQWRGWLWDSLVLEVV
ncbi:polysaccharide lyase family 4 protein [Curvularia clavata]|uniref:rhamnogalacturonan endolyase n=1 Tax=Curvularia clavata TaxID=95742 RepID=A0A9Q9DPE8_CURCL|nr:polysaccharide lyase family 4 protein [Curvularia clavata]